MKNYLKPEIEIISVQTEEYMLELGVSVLNPDASDSFGNNQGTATDTLD